MFCGRSFVLAQAFGLCTLILWQKTRQTDKRAVVLARERKEGGESAGRTERTEMHNPKRPHANEQNERKKKVCTKQLEREKEEERGQTNGQRTKSRRNQHKPMNESNVRKRIRCKCPIERERKG